MADGNEALVGAEVDAGGGRPGDGIEADGLTDTEGEGGGGGGGHMVGKGRHTIKKEAKNSVCSRPLPISL